MITTIRGTRFHYIDQGEGIPVLWIHGYPLSSALFAEQLSIRGVRHLVPDLPGFGESDSAGIASIEEYARALLSILDGIPLRKVVVAGLSMGGYVALTIARIAPERISALVLIDTKETADSPDAKRVRYDTAEQVRANGTRPVIDSMLPKLLSESSSHDPLLVSRTITIMESASAEGVVDALKVMAERPDSSSVLSSLAIPVLIAVGEHDAITPPSEAGRMLGLARNARLLVVPKAGHLSILEQPEAFNEAFVDFLRTELDADVSA